MSLMTILWVWLGLVLFGVLAIAGAASVLRDGGPPDPDYGELGTGESNGTVSRSEDED